MARLNELTKYPFLAPNFGRYVISRSVLALKTCPFQAHVDAPLQPNFRDWPKDDVLTLKYLNQAPSLHVAFCLAYVRKCAFLYLSFSCGRDKLSGPTLFSNVS